VQLASNQRVIFTVAIEPVSTASGELTAPSAYLVILACRPSSSYGHQNALGWIDGGGQHGILETKEAGSQLDGKVFNGL
jgi:hypothetical protein